MSADGPQDLLADVEGLQCWLLANGLIDRCEADEKSRTALISAREAILQALQSDSVGALNEVLDRGRIRLTLTPTGPAEAAEVAKPEWLAGWLAAGDLLRLLGEAPDRIKQCAHPHCILWFHDTSKNGARRWHSMATCGNRAKAARHYAAKRE
ncbi:CGNR zinc finger [Mycolicibacterium neworleansense]|uniref:CGNR zinc finger n=2 Tax=Mycolicibacterium neworleansense TaxID=146018 RepID=A0A0H5RJ27_9MYCO|nr:CGNR zinc finger [Mycolicibacterium neworleansense]